MQELTWIISTITLTDIVDIVIVALLIYGVTFLFRGTQAAALFRGILSITIVLLLVTTILNLQALSWLLNNALQLLLFAIPVIFQPELRRGLEQIGRGGLFIKRETPETIREQIVIEICKAAEKLAERRHGALIVLQRNSEMDDFIATGVRINSAVKAELLLTIFWPKTELHDGAVIIDRSGMIASAAAVLPLTANRNLPNPKMGTRHRAALGISEVSDAICVVVSEETGKIAVTNGGRMVSRLDLERLRTILNAFYGSERPQSRSIAARVSEWANTLAGRFDQVRKRFSS